MRRRVTAEGDLIEIYLESSSTRAMATTVDSGSVELPARREFKPKLRTKSQLEQELDVYQSGHNGFKKVRSMSTVCSS